MTLVAGGTTICTVLILVLVEDGLGELTCYTPTLSTRCLNPCFSGGWSRSAAKAGGDQFDAAVLILVLVEDGLGGQTNLAGHPLRDRLNPCFSGGWSRRKSWGSCNKKN